MKITYISSYVPRKCGIATYTRDLAEEVEAFGNEIPIIAMENPVTSYKYSKPVHSVIPQNDKASYIEQAKKINKDASDIVHLQHEFGLFGGKDGKFILNFAKALKKPLVTTFHTILLTPSETQKKIIQELSRLSRSIVVMDKIGKDRLETIYGLNPQDISIILHGAPLINKTDSTESKKIIGYPNRFIMLANNLLSRNKGIEYGIESVAKALKKIPNLLFLIVGETHPVVKIEQGESYRNELMDLVKKLGIEKNVIFKNEYVSKDELKIILSAADVYITPYLDPQQISSGTLSYAIGAGKACIATEYVYAKEMLSQNRGIIVPFRNSDAIAKALKDLYLNPEKRHLLEDKVSKTGIEMTWGKAAEKHIEIYELVLKKDSGVSSISKQFIKSDPDISYLKKMTDSKGMIQHSIKNSPDLSHGYSTCDNSRALIAACLLNNNQASDEYLELIKIYSDFTISAQVKDGSFHTFLNSAKKWTDVSEAADGLGRALWGIGFNIYSEKDNRRKRYLTKIFDKSLNQLNNITDIRAAAYSLLGLYYYISSYPEDSNSLKPAIAQFKRLANYLKKSYIENSSKNWNWFETKITYDNFRIPQSLFAVFLITKVRIFKDIAEEALRFITRINFNKANKFYDFIGQDGWHGINAKKATYDQQPLEASSAMDANIFAYLATGEKKYIKESERALEWFFGNNRNHRYMIDLSSGGIYDGLTSRGVNVNQGAESIICFLISTQMLKQTKQSLATSNSAYIYSDKFPLSSLIN